MPKTYFVHPTTEVGKDATIGEGTQVWRFGYIYPKAKIGKNCKIGQNVVIHSTAVLGNNVKIQNNVSIYDGVTLEDDVFCGPSCVFTNIINPRSAIDRNSAKFYQKTLIKKGATIGANVTIVCGVTVGKYAFIGAGAVVTKNVNDYELVFGNPATSKGWISEAGENLVFRRGKAVCPASKKSYIKINSRVMPSK